MERNLGEREKTKISLMELATSLSSIIPREDKQRAERYFFSIVHSR